MPKTRRALLISNPGETGDPDWCGGVAVDIQRYTAFLMSAQGGVWYQSEIIHLLRPTPAAVKAEVAKLGGVDYSFVAFAGHGWYSKADGATALLLSKGVSLSSIELRTGGNKRSIVLDCCREKHAESAYLEARSKAIMNMSAASGRRNPNPYECRPLFDREIELADTGRVIIESCSPGEKAADNDRTGGLYTSCLLDTAEEWVESKAVAGGLPTRDSLSIAAAHIPAAKETERQAGGGKDAQHPTITKARTVGRFFPFAVYA